MPVLTGRDLQACKVVLAEEFVSALAPPELQSKMKRFSIKEFIEEHPMLKKYRNPACGMTLQLCEGGRREEVACDEDQGGCANLNCGQAGCVHRAKCAKLQCHQVTVCTSYHWSTAAGAGRRLTSPASVRTCGTGMQSVTRTVGYSPG